MIKKEIVKSTKVLIEKDIHSRSREMVFSKLDFQDIQPKKYVHKRAFSFQQRKNSLISLQQNLERQKMLNSPLLFGWEGGKMGIEPEHKNVSIKPKMMNLKQQNLLLISNI